MKEFIFEVLGVFSIINFGIYLGLMWSNKRRVRKSGLWVVTLLASIGTLVWYVSKLDVNPLVEQFVSITYVRDGLNKDFGIISFITVLTAFGMMVMRSVLRESWR